MTDNPLCQLFNIKYPIIQAGMVWVSGGKLAAAAANSGILGLIGAGSMKLDILEENIKKAQELTDKSFGVNVPIMYPHASEQIDLALKMGIKIFFLSAGSPKKFTKYLKDHGAIVTHVTSSPTLAKKCEEAGVDAVVAEGFEAGGHNGREELTSMVLIPQMVDAVKIPVIAAGGFYDGRGILAAMSLGAEGVQMGTRFVVAQESSAHPHFKQAIIEAGTASTKLMMKKVVPVRLMQNSFAAHVQKLEDEGASKDELVELLGKGRARLGMFEGNLEDGELEIGQVCSALHEIRPLSEIVESLWKEYLDRRKDLLS